MPSEQESFASRKRLRRDTRSCYECRRRKVKCQLISEDVTACSECLKNGVRCSVSEPVSDQPSGQALGQAAQQDLEQRLERIESLLHILVGTRERSESDQTQTQPQVANSAGPDPDISSILSLLLDNNNSDSQMAQPPSFQPPSATSSTSAKQSLLSLLPSVEDAAIIIDNTLAWVLELPDPPGLAVKQSGVGTHDILVVSQQCSTVVVAKNLLYFALYIQQLPADFDPERLQMADFESRVPQYVEAVSSAVLVDDETLCTEEGFDCLILLAAIHFNDARFQSAWLSFRRALDVARLLGFTATSPSDNIRSRDQLQSTYLQRKWLAAAIGENYCGVLLGLEPTSTLESFKSEEGDSASSGLDPDVEFFRQILPIAHLYIKRNDFQLYQGYAPTQALDKALDELEDSMPESWWRMPTPIRERSVESAQQHHRLVCQMWVYQLRIMTHLPYLVHPEMSEGSRSGRKRAIEAARIMLHRFLLHRQPGQVHIHCRVIELGAFLASVAILLGTTSNQDAPGNQAREAIRRNNPDILLVEQVINSLEALGRASRRELFCKQSAEVLSALLAETTFPGNSLEPSMATRLSETILQGKEPAVVSDTVAPSTTEPLRADHPRRKTELYDLLACSFPQPLGALSKNPSDQIFAESLSSATSLVNVLSAQTTNAGEALELADSGTTWDYGVIDWDA